MINKIKLTEIQKKARLVVSKNKITLLYGGSRSGKTFFILYLIVFRALMIESRHLIARFRFNHIKQSICFDTMPKIFKMLGIQEQVILNKSDWFYKFPNGSKIWIAGLDDKERTEKILGNEYATIFLNEGSQISYDTFETVLTRLNPPSKMSGKIIIDYNPPSIHHWGYKIFNDRKFPDNRKVPDTDYGSIKMNPKDNLENLSKEYLSTLEMLSESKRKRFIDGDYSLDNGSLWRRGWIKNKDIPESLERVVIGVDPTGTVGGDECGIIAVGMKKGEFFVLDDFSMNGTPAEWSSEVATIYQKWNADLVVAEKNYGGDMVESTIKNALFGINVKLIVSSRSKILRAEPISALYERNLVFHRTNFNELEDEMCMYTPEITISPNRLDAVVFGLTELSTVEISIFDVI